MTPREPTDEPIAQHALQGVSNTVRGLLYGADRDEVQTRYTVGELLRRVKGTPQTYGTRAIEHRAEELGFSMCALYRYISVAECWSKEDLSLLLDRTNRFGRPLSWSHLVALTSVAENAREAILHECLENAWTARELEHRVEMEQRPPSRDSDAAHTGEPVHAALKEGIQTLGRAVADVRMFSQALSHRLGDLATPINGRLIARALDVLNEARTELDAAEAQLKVATDSQKRLRVAPTRTEDLVPGEEHEGDLDAMVEPHPAKVRLKRR
jgi:hypothetical protein